jgi:hypothetical protein
MEKASLMGGNIRITGDTSRLRCTMLFVSRRSVPALLWLKASDIATLQDAYGLAAADDVPSVQPAR